MNIVRRQNTMHKIVSRQIQSSGREVRTRVFNSQNYFRAFVISLVAVIAIPLIVHSSISASFTGQVSSEPNEMRHASALVLVSNDNDNEWQHSLQLAVKAYKAGKVDKFVVIGDTTRTTTVTSSGVLPNDIITLPGKSDIYADCYQLKIEKQLLDVILVAHEYNMYSNLYLCTAAGIEVQGLIASTGGAGELGLKLRDVMAMPQAAWQVSLGLQ